MDHRSRQQRLFEQHPGWLFLLNADPSIRYLTGYEAEARLLLSADHTILFVDEDDRYHGPKPAPNAAAIDDVQPSDALSSVLRKALEDTEVVGYRLGRSHFLDALLLERLEEHRGAKPRTGRGLLPIHDPEAAIGALRLIKDQQEIRALKDAARKSAKAMRALMSAIRPGLTEREVAARYRLELAQRGGQETAYPPIVAAGERAVILHATPSDRRLAPDELVLIDAAGTVDGYASDLTRTLPVGPRFDPWAALYQLVHDAQEAAIARVRPGVTIDEPHQAARTVFADGLAQVGLDPKTLDDLFPHRTSHWLGLEAHDTGLYVTQEGPRLLESNMVLTVEPGLYVPLDSDAPEHMRGVGIRIEDTVLVTSDGCNMLTGEAPKSSSEIESRRINETNLA